MGTCPGICARMERWQQTGDPETERMELWCKDTTDHWVSLRDSLKVPLPVSAKKCLNNPPKMLIWVALVRAWPCRNSRGGFLGRRYPRDVIFIPERFIKWAGFRTVEEHDYGGGLLSFSPENVAMWQISIKKWLSQRSKPSQLIYVIAPLPQTVSSLTIETAPTLNSHFINSESKWPHCICPKYDPPEHTDLSDTAVVTFFHLNVFNSCESTRNINLTQT